MRLPRIAFASLLLLAVAVPLAWLIAGVPEYAATEIAIGTDPVDVVVVDDRIVATLLGTDSVTVSWIDSGAFDEGPFTIGLDGDEARALEAATLSGEPVVFVGGDQVDVLRFDLSAVPAEAPSVDTSVGLGADDAGLLVALEWDSARSALYGADGAQGLLRRVDFSGDEPSIDGDGWPLELAFTPTCLALLDGSTVLVAGQDAGWPVLALVDLSDPSDPSAVELDPGDATALPVAVQSDGAGRAWILLHDGEIWTLVADDVGDDDDSASDDDDSATDDDDSATDDDDSATDDDDSATDDDDSATDDDDSAVARDHVPRDGWLLEFFADGPTDGSDLVWRSVDGADVLYASGGNQVHVIEAAGDVSAAFTISGATSALAASSATDGFVYATAETDQLAVLSAGPWITLDTVAPTQIGDLSDEIVVDFTVTTGAETDGSCTWTMAVDADIDGGGTALTATGTASHGVAAQATLTGAELPGGEHRVWLFCAEADGDVGRASFAYESTVLSAPAGFSLDPDDGEVTASWTDDGSASSWVLYFDDETFDEDDSPTLCNSDSSICSPHQILRDSDSEDEARDDDDDSAGDDDDTAVDDDDTTESDTDTISVDVTGLVNGTTYWFAVAGRTSDGEDGPRSSTLSATPSRTGGAAVLAGDVGGCSCNDSLIANRATTAWALLPLLLMLRRRRSSGKTR